TGAGWREGGGAGIGATGGGGRTASGAGSGTGAAWYISAWISRPPSVAMVLPQSGQVCIRLLGGRQHKGLQQAGVFTHRPITACGGDVDLPEHRAARERDDGGGAPIHGDGRFDSWSRRVSSHPGVRVVE